MEVELVDYQPNALAILLYTKNTRLRGEFPDLESVERMDLEWQLDQLAYMRDTIQSSWEFADYIFNIKGVSRNFTHQLVRTRTASFAQEAQRVVDLGDTEYLIPEQLDLDRFDTIAGKIYKNIWEQETAAYQALVGENVPRQDARNVIGTGVLTSIIVKANLRTLHNMAELRLCFRVQDEYQKVFSEMKKRVVEVHPWAEDFIQVFCVNHGTCAFPRYTECPIQHLTIRGPELNKVKMVIKKAHAETKHEANPIVNKEGKTM